MHDAAAAGESVLTRLERAQEAHLRAKRADALALLSGGEDWPHPANEKAIALRAEVLTPADPIAALQELAAHQDAFTSLEGRFEYLIVSARAYTNTRNFEVAREVLDAAAQLLAGPDDPKASRVAYHRARLDVITHQFDANSADFPVALRDTDPALRFNALSWRSWMHAGLEDYHAQMRDLREAFALYEQYGYRCGLVSVATSLHAMLRLGFELGDAEAVAAGEAAYETIAWTPEIADYRFLCTRALGWDAFLRGDPARAQWQFKDSKDLAPTAAWKVMAHVDRAYVARMNDNEAWALEELEQASALAERVTWSATKGEERVALVTLAVLYAPVDMPRAQRYVSTYISLGSDSIDPTLAAASDRRALAFEKYATGCVQQMMGNTPLAVRALESAFEIFSQSEHHYRAALAAAALYEATKEPAWLQMARSSAAHFPHSGVYRNLTAPQSARPSHDMTELTPLQRQLAAAVAEGLDITQLSQRFSRSTFTIERQLDEIASRLKVPSRASLRSELRKRSVHA